MAPVDPRIQKVLSCLVGKEFWSSAKAGLRSFQFGERRSGVTSLGRERVVGEYALHTWQPWRLRGPEGIETGDGDDGWPAGIPLDDDDGWNWDYQGRARSDERLDAYFERGAANPPVVQSVEVDEVAGFGLHLSDGYTLEVFPDDSRGGED